MRITRTRYESAKNKLSKMETLLKITAQWEKTMEGLGDAVAANVVAIETTKEGTVKVEFETNCTETRSVSTLPEKEH